MKLVFSYDEIFNKFNTDLLYKLRKHGSDENYLNLWVPDEDFLRSFESLTESIKTLTFTGFTLNVDKKYMNKVTFLRFKRIYPKINIENKVNFFLIHVKDSDVLNSKKKIVDKVSNKKQQKINYYYGSLGLQKNKQKFKSFFLNYYENNKANNKHLSKPKHQTETLKIKINKNNVNLVFNNLNEFIEFRLKTKNKYLLGCLYFFNKTFYKKNLYYIAKNGIHDFITAINNNCKNPIKGILLPFNFGDEVFFVNLLCQFIFKKFSYLIENEISSDLWFKKKIDEKKYLCKVTLKKFLKKENENSNSIIFKDIQNDVNKKPIRIIVSTSELIDSRKKPNLLRRFENFIKKELCMLLQVLHEEKKDLNKIRRL